MNNLNTGRYQVQADGALHDIFVSELLHVTYTPLDRAHEVLSWQNTLRHCTGELELQSKGDLRGSLVRQGTGDFEVQFEGERRGSLVGFCTGGSEVHVEGELHGSLARRGTGGADVQI